MSGEHKQTFTGRHLVNVLLTGPSSDKITRHHEIAIENPPVAYLPGDALGALPHNSPELVARILKAVGATGDEPVDCPDGTKVAAHRALTEIYNLSTPSRRLLELMVARGATDLAPLLDKAHAESLRHYLSAWDDAHDVLDVLED